MAKTKKAPTGLTTASAAWWKKTVHELALSTPVEIELATQAARTLDFIAECEQSIKHQGLNLQGQRGPVTNPAAKELRNQRGLFATLARSLNVCVRNRPRPRPRKEPNEWSDY